MLVAIIFLGQAAHNKFKLKSKYYFRNMATPVMFLFNKYDKCENSSCDSKACVKWHLIENKDILKNVVVGVFSIDTITVQQVYLAWDNEINAHPRPCFIASKMIDGGRVAGFVQVYSVH